MDISIKENERKIPKEHVRSLLLRELPQKDLEELNLSLQEMEQGRCVVSAEKSFVCSASSSPKW